jgi:hypothetical protein
MASQATLPKRPQLAAARIKMIHPLASAFTGLVGALALSAKLVSPRIALVMAPHPSTQCQLNG